MFVVVKYLVKVVVVDNVSEDGMVEWFLGYEDG